jgi:hypothetical protein
LNPVERNLRQRGVFNLRVVRIAGYRYLDVRLTGGSPVYKGAGLQELD